MSRIVITPGEPAGIGPDIVVQIAQQSWPVELVVVSNPELLLSRAKRLKLPGLGKLNIIPVDLPESCEPGTLNGANANFVVECLKVAIDLCLAENIPLVTGPVQKSLIPHFTGHTEFLAQYCKAKSVLMMFVVNELKVALLTTHLPLRQVPDAITQEKIIDALQLLHRELIDRFGIKQPRILVAGLNPHAGEKGHLGREEIEVIAPAIEILQRQGIDAIGPYPADTLFIPHLQKCDAILAMYHDQALPVVKYLGFDKAVNVTLGLPIIRTSVDHGTALDVAGTLGANPSSMEEAIKLAIKLIQSRNKT